MAQELAIPGPGKLHKTRSEPIQNRRYSTCFIGNKTVEANALPNYLRPSSGSCHDSCKFGTQHDFKTIERTPLVKGFVAARRRSMDLPKADIGLDQIKSSFNTSRTTPNSQSRIHERQAAAKPKITTEDLKQELPKSNKELRPRNMEIGKLKGAFNSTGQKSSPRTSKVPRNSSTNKETYSPRTTSSRVPKKEPYLKGNNNKTSAPATRFPTRKPDAKTAPKKFMNVESNDGPKEATTHQSNNHEDVPEKIIHVVEINTQNFKDFATEEKEMQDDASLDLLPKVEEIIEPVPQKVRTLSDNQKESAAAEDSQDIQSQSPRKLKFKKAKRIDIQSPKSSAGRRLKFKQAEQLSPENVQHKTGETMRKKSSRKPDSGSDRDRSNTTTSEANELVLRSQHPQEKEQSESLYNDVINETAEKLVRDKKSNKVKALVDAFETIISLQA